MIRIISCLLVGLTIGVLSYGVSICVTAKAYLLATIVFCCEVCYVRYAKARLLK